MKKLLGWLAQPVFVVVVVWLALGGPDFQFDTPLMFSGDALYFLAQAKATIDHGWWWTNPSLAAPSTLHAVLLPWGGNVDQIIVRITGLAVRGLPQHNPVQSGHLSRPICGGWGDPPCHG